MALRWMVAVLVVLVVGTAACAASGTDGVTFDEPIGAPDAGSTVTESSNGTSSVTEPSVVKTASVETEVARDELSTAAQNVVDIATDPKVGGFLVSSIVDTTEGYGAARVAVKVPAPSFELVVSEFATLGELQRQKVAGDNLTAAALATRSDLLRTERLVATLRARLRNAENETDRVQLRQQVATNRQQLAKLREQSRNIAAQTEFSEIDVALIGTAPPAPARKPALERSFDMAKSISLGIASAALLAAGVLVPIALLLLLLYPLGARLFRRARPRLQT